MIATGYKIPSKDKAIMISSGGTKEKVAMLDAARALVKNGYTICASEGTAKFLNDNNVKATAVAWPDEEGSDKPNVMKMIADHKFDLIVNIPKNHSKRELTNTNSKLRDAIAKAKSNNMPNDNINRSIKKAAGELDSVNYEEFTYEGYAAGGVAVIVECLTDNKNRTAGDVRHLFDKFGGSLGSRCQSRRY